jgi:hypothetical protein
LTTQIQAKFHEDLRLIGDETLDSFMASLCDAMDDLFPGDEAHAYVSDVASDWLIFCVIGEEGENRHFKVSYSRTDSGEFVFGDAVPVEKVVSVSYEPVPVDDLGDEPEDDEGEEGEDDDAEDMDEAVDNPSPEQRRDLPDAAYAIVLARGKGLVPRKSLPHHINTVKSPTDDSTVDLPRLRNALARISQVRDVPEAVLRRGLAHLQAHARRLKIGQFAKEAYEVLQLLDLAMDQLDSGGINFALIESMVNDMEKNRKPTEGDETLSSEYVENFIIEAKKLKSGKSYTDMAPSGKKFLAVYEARGGIVGKINDNGRLYSVIKADENCSRMKDQIERAYAEGKSMPVNFHLKGLVGEADHPDSAPRLPATCTMLLDVYRDGTDMRIAFGLMDTSVGRDVRSLIEYGMPVGISTRSYGYSETKMMDAKNPYFSLNTEKCGKEYEEIYDFQIEAFDLVVQPSARTYVNEATDNNDQKIREAIQRLCSPASEEEEKPMTKEEMLAQLSLEDVQTLAPTLFEAITATVKVEPVPAPVVEAEKDDARVTALEGELRETRAELAAQRAVVDAMLSEKQAIENEKKEAERKVSLSAAIADFCGKKEHGAYRQAYMADLLLSDSSKTVEHLDEASQKFEKTFHQVLSNMGQTSQPEGKAKKAVTSDQKPAVKTENLWIPVSAITKPSR